MYRFDSTRENLFSIRFGPIRLWFLKLGFDPIRFGLSTKNPVRFDSIRSNRMDSGRIIRFIGISCSVVQDHEEIIDGQRKATTDYGFESSMFETVVHVIETIQANHDLCAKRSLKKLPDHLKDQSHKHVRQEVRRIRAQLEVLEQNQKHSLEPPSKRMKNQTSFFARFESGNLSEEANEAGESGNESEEFEFDFKKGDELDRYLLLELDQNQKTDPLEFWKNHQLRFPCLSRHARAIFSIPATTTNVEREFSAVGF
ncbi:unnamed protein product [Didymodactylos carnosus]|uniref:HAT C-terminal dimerisation domain-containing protein n=1 Tax=Didymodactylos carnosus TaxID=1234261 RepID=A0A815GCN1_9BILA|nr:unnamed protein product [Didymodactylos carnosus]CAF4194316.1 unnamed protein product [Didymodactylos carnosus]